MSGDDGVVRNAERSSIEIKDLLRKLHPDRGQHKDRIRRLNRFRNYVMPSSNGATPEFYDDDIPLFYLGAETPAIYLDEDEDVPLGLYYGILLACGYKNEETGHLKRSARHTMNLLKWLLCDWHEANQQLEFNIFARSFLALPVKYYSFMQLNMHVIGDDRGGAKEDACHLVAYILTNHLAEDGETPSPVLLEELVTLPQAQQAFDLWSARANLPQQQQEIIKKNTIARQAEIALQQRQEALVNKSGGAQQTHGDDLDLLIDDHDHDGESENEGGDDHHHHHHDDDSSSEEDVDELDVMAAIRKRQKIIRRELKAAENRGEITASKGAAATRWDDSQLAREQAMREKSANIGQANSAVREAQDEARELQEREDEKAKVQSKDPLGIQQEEEIDMRKLERAQAEQVELALHEVQEEIQKAESAGNEEMIKKAAYMKESLEQLIEKLGGLEAMENQNSKASILPTNQKFNPLLFLTLVHRKTAYKDLMGSMVRLSSKTENQAEQLQNLVRDNFPLFVRCAEGFEEFRTKSEAEVGLGVNERIEKLEAIAESSAFQAKKSFKPLLDNTSEVRKVQSALSVMQRVAPILQVPALMRQHIDNRRYSQAIKTYRRCLVIDDSCNISLLNHVKRQAESCVRDARRDLERRLTQDNVSLEDLLDGVRDLSELLDLDVITQEDKKKGESSNESVDGKSEKEKHKRGSKDKTSVKQEDEEGIHTVDGTTVNIREHPPALACLLLQSAHFSSSVKSIIGKAEETAERIFAGESLTTVQTTEKKKKDPAKKDEKEETVTKATGNQWKYDVLDARVLTTIKAVDAARIWIPRLVRVAKAAREEEKRRAAKIGVRGRANMKGSHLSAFEVVVVNIAPPLSKLVEHAAFCSLGSNTRTGAKYVEMTFGSNTDEKLRTLLRSPLPPSQSTKVGKELAVLGELLDDCAIDIDGLRSETSLAQASPVEPIKALANSAIITIEKRRCIYAFDVCSRACSNRASGSGKFDAEALLTCLQTLSEQLTRPEECANEVEKGCELVIRRCCEGLASYVRDRGDDARLNAVAECADILSGFIEEVMREASYLTPNSEAVQQVVMEDMMGLESAMFDEYLENIRMNVANNVRVGWLDKDASEKGKTAEEAIDAAAFPSYLSASLLAIARCRAQVEQALGNRIRKSEGVTYQHMTMATVADGVVEGICNEVAKRKLKLKVRQADRLANELEFLKNTLKKFLSDETSEFLESTLRAVNARAGHQGNGPDGLAALEELERLGRVYVLCLGD